LVSSALIKFLSTFVFIFYIIPISLLLSIQTLPKLIFSTSIFSGIDNYAGEEKLSAEYVIKASKSTLTYKRGLYDAGENITGVSIKEITPDPDGKLNKNGHCIDGGLYFPENEMVVHPCKAVLRIHGLFGIPYKEIEIKCYIIDN
jgi:hypothetical protein